MMRDIADRGALAREDRSYTLADLEVREDDDGGITFEGIASSVDSPYIVRDAFGEFEETVVAGAFKKTLREKDDVRLLVNHEGVPLARTKSKTLALAADPHLRAEAKLDPANPTVQEIRSAMSRGDLDQMSIGFRVTRQEWNGDYTVRQIRELQLFDVSVVTYPANPATTASVRSLDQFMSAITADVSESEMRAMLVRLEAAMESRGMFHEDLRSHLRTALMERYPVGPDRWLWVRDFSDDQVIFELDGFDEPGTYRLGYTTDGQGVTLAEGDAEKVEAVTTYVTARSQASLGVYADLAYELLGKRHLAA